jgi:hypothetical protein
MKQDRIFETPEKKKRRVEEQNDNLLIMTPPNNKNYPRKDDITSPFELNESKMINSNKYVESYAKQYLNNLLFIDNNIDYNDPNTQYSDKIDFDINYTIDKIRIFINNKNDESIYSKINTLQFMAAHAVNITNFNSNIKHFVILTCMVYPLVEKYNINISDFTNISNNNIKIITEMISYMNTDTNNVMNWKLIPKYIRNLSRMQPDSIIEFANYVNQPNLHNEINNFIQITNKYVCNLNNDYIKDVYRNCLTLINNIGKINNEKITINHIKDVLY